MKYGKTERATLELHGWGVGDILEGDGEYPQRIKITAIGEEAFLCRVAQRKKGGFSTFGEEEGNFTLTCRNWVKVDGPAPSEYEDEYGIKPILAKYGVGGSQAEQEIASVFNRFCEQYMNGREEVRREAFSEMNVYLQRALIDAAGTDDPTALRRRITEIVEVLKTIPA